MESSLSPPVAKNDNHGAALGDHIVPFEMQVEPLRDGSSGKWHTLLEESDADMLSPPTSRKRRGENYLVNV